MKIGSPRGPFAQKSGSNISIHDWIIITFWNSRWRPPPSWIFENLISEHRSTWAADFPALYQIWCKNVHRHRNYGPKSKSKMTAVRRNRAYMPILAEIGQAVQPGREMKKPIKAMKETYSGKLGVRPDHPRWHSDNWFCVPSGLRELVISFKFHRNWMNGFGDTGGVEFRHFLLLWPVAYITNSLYTVSHKKRATLFLIITPAFLGRFLYFLYQ